MTPAPRTLLAAAIAAVALAPLGASAQVTLQPAPIVDPNMVYAPPPQGPWAFAVPAVAGRVVAAPATLPDAMRFEVSTTGVAPALVTRVGFQIMGTLQPGDVASYELVYYPTGFANPGVVVGSDTGAGWARGAKKSMVDIALTTPVAVQGDFTGAFALRATAKAKRSFYFQPRLQTITLSSNGVASPLLNSELPINGDRIFVN